MARSWSLQEAKSQFSQVVKEAQIYGPQMITRHGVETAVVLSYTDYQQLVAGQQKLSEFFRSSPLVGVDLDLARDTSPGYRAEDQ
jgi:antitoxin Phd